MKVHAAFISARTGNRKKYSGSNETRNLFRHKSRLHSRAVLFELSFIATRRAAFLALVITSRISYSDAVRRRDSYEISLELFRSPNATRGSSTVRGSLE